MFLVWPKARNTENIGNLKRRYSWKSLFSLDRWCSTVLASRPDGQCWINLWAGSSGALTSHTEEDSSAPIHPCSGKGLGWSTWTFWGGGGRLWPNPDPAPWGRGHGIFPWANGWGMIWTCGWGERAWPSPEPAVWVEGMWPGPVGEEDTAWPWPGHPEVKGV